LGCDSVKRPYNVLIEIALMPLCLPVGSLFLWLWRCKNGHHGSPVSSRQSQNNFLVMCFFSRETKKASPHTLNNFAEPPCQMKCSRNLPKSDTLTRNTNGRHEFFSFKEPNPFCCSSGSARPQPRSWEMFIAHYVLIYSSLFNITSSWRGLRLLKSPLTSCILRVVRDV
jgi:hypothetical protein